MTDTIKIHTDFRLRAAENGGWTVAGVSSAGVFDTPIGAYTTAADMIHALARMLGVDLDGPKCGPCKADPDPAFDLCAPDDLRVEVYRGTDCNIATKQDPAPRAGMVRIIAGHEVVLPPGAVVTGAYYSGSFVDLTYQIPAARPANRSSTVTQDYYGTKRITAWPQERDGQPGYAVKYSDGYISWSPKPAFEEAYQPLTAMSFGHAIAAMKAGHRVARAGWNGKGMWLQLAKPPHSATPNDMRYDVSVGDEYTFLPGIKLLPWIGMKTADNRFVPWLASQTDMLADDWQIIE